MTKRDELPRSALHCLIVSAACACEVGRECNDFYVPVGVIPKLDAKREIITSPAHFSCRALLMLLVGAPMFLVERSLDLMAEDVVKTHAQNLQAALNKTDGVWRVSVRADRRALNYSYRFKKPTPTHEDFFRASSLMQKQLLADYCSQKWWKGKELKVMETNTIYSSKGERLISFTIGPADCGQW